MNVLFSIDKGFTGLLISCMRSVLRNGGAEHYRVFVLHSDLEPEEQARLRRELGRQVECHFVSVDPAIFADFPESKRYPKQIYYRLAAPLLLPKDLDRILYLDVDTVVINPLTELYETSFDGAYYVACTHTREFLSKVNQARLKAPKSSPYVNTGVLLLNLPALRENLRLEDIRAYAEKQMHTFILPDQDILTGLYGDKIKLVDTMRYNLSDRVLRLYNTDPKNEQKVDVAWVRENSAIIHYCGKKKPWKENYTGTLGVFYQEETQIG
jgi:lipopolysaccharide biosynthesis glycosyltransferase